MALQLAPAPDSPYGQQRTGRPQSQYYPNDPAAAGNQVMSPRARSQSVAGNRQVTKGGIPILHYGKFLSFSNKLQVAIHVYIFPQTTQMLTFFVYSSRNVHVPSRHPRGIVLC
jgi:hypothetical protein